MARTQTLAFISDVHSNLEALEAVVADLGETETYCLGDMVGYGASPNEVIRLLAERRVTCILGNHDSAVLRGRANEFNSRALRAVMWTIKNLDEEGRAFLSALPTSRRISFAGTPVYMTHGSPDDNLWEYVFPVTHSDLFGFYLSRLGVRLIALGHTHVPFVSEVPEGVVFNPGSVGQPRTGDNRASYALVKETRTGVEVIHRYVSYDIEKAARKIVAAGLPESLAARLFRGD